MLVNEQLPKDLKFSVYHNGEEKQIDLNDYKGKWLVLVFYPADFTFICPTELGEFANLYDKFKEEGAEVISVSTDTVFVHKAWHDKSQVISKIKFPMLADPSGRLCRLFGTYIEPKEIPIDDEGLSLRGTFIIDPDSKLKMIEIHDNSIGRNANETLRKLQAAKFVRENNGEVCPASWVPGGNTLKPGMNLVGEI